MSQVCLKSFSKPELEAWIRSLNEKPYRAHQIWSWMYTHCATSFDEMTNLSKTFRTKVAEIATLTSLRLLEKKNSPVSGTIKFLWECEDRSRIESVFIPEGKRRTVCISTQVGCPLACRFCATGRMGFFRNLQTHEIVDQVIQIQKEIGMALTNVVVMGMGEPFLNYEAVLKALDILNTPEGPGIGHRKITLSTVGIIPGIKRYTFEKRPYKLAVSLNATTDETRTRLMPINKKYPLVKVLEAIKEYVKQTKKRPTFEYVLIRGINDTPADANRLLKLLKNIPCKVNLIPYNSIQGPFETPEPERVQAFWDILRSLPFPVMIRHSRGGEIQAACGQLAVAYMNRKQTSENE